MPWNRYNSSHFVHEDTEAHIGEVTWIGLITKEWQSPESNAGQHLWVQCPCYFYFISFYCRDGHREITGKEIIVKYALKEKFAEVYNCLHMGDINIKTLLTKWYGALTKF